MSKFKDEGKNRDLAFDSVNNYGGTQFFWPLGDEYRVTLVKGRYGIQSRVNNCWYDLMEYDNGWFDGSRLGPATWVKVSNTCLYSESSINDLRVRLLKAKKFSEPSRDKKPKKILVWLVIIASVIFLYRKLRKGSR